MVCWRKLDAMRRGPLFDGAQATPKLDGTRREPKFDGAHPQQVWNSFTIRGPHGAILRAHETHVRNPTRHPPAMRHYNVMPSESEAPSPPVLHSCCLISSTSHALYHLTTEGPNHSTTQSHKLKPLNQPIRRPRHQSVSQSTRQSQRKKQSTIEQTNQSMTNNVPTPYLSYPHTPHDLQ